MQRSTKLALIAAGLGLSTLGAVATTAVRAASTEAAADTEVTTATATTTDTSPPLARKAQHLAEMAKLVGLTTDQLQTELSSGKEFYQIAAAHGVTYDEVKDNASSAYQAKLDDMVKVGYLTQSQADAFLQQWQERATESPMLGLGFGGHGHGQMGM